MACWKVLLLRAATSTPSDSFNRQCTDTSTFCMLSHNDFSYAEKSFTYRCLRQGRSLHSGELSSAEVTHASSPVVLHSVPAGCNAPCKRMRPHSVMWQERAQSMWDACMFAHHVLSLVLRQAAFEAIFASFDKGNKGGLMLQEMYQFTQATRLVRQCPLT